MTIERQPADQRTDDSSARDVLLVRLDQEIYAIASSSVRGVARHRPITPVPGAPPALPGILSLRGTIFPVVDARVTLGLTQTPATRATRLALLSHEDVDLALLVDAVLDLMQLPADSIDPAPAALDPARARLLRGITRHEGRPVMLLDIDELIASLREWS